MKVDKDPEDPLARLAQEATNQSPPDKSLSGTKERSAPKNKPARHRTKAPRT